MAILMLSIFFTAVACDTVEESPKPFEPHEDNIQEPDTSPIEPKPTVVTITFYDDTTLIAEHEFTELDIIVPVAPAKENMRFEGWYFDRTFSQIFDITQAKNYIVDYKISVYAQYVAMEEITPNIDIKFYVDDVLSNTITIQKGDVFAMPTNPTKIHHTFAGWYKDRDFCKPYDHMTELANGINESLTLHAKFEEITATLTLLVNGREYNKITTKSSIKATLPAPPIFEDMTFVEWVIDGTNTSFDLGRYYAQDEVTDCTISARYVRNNSLVILGSNGNIIDTLIVKRGDELILPTPSRNISHSFDYWAKNGEKFDVEAYNALADRQDVTLDAIWRKRENAITFIVDDVTYKTCNVTHDSLLELPDTPTSANKKFIRWYILNGTEKVTFDYQTYINDIDRTDISIYAEFANKLCEVTFKYGNNIVSNETIFEGDIITLPSPPLVDNAIFIEWQYNGSKFDVKSINNALKNKPKNIDSNMLIEAKYELKNTIIQFIVDNDEHDSITYNNDTIFVYPSEPKIEGYTFAGWYYDEECTHLFDEREYKNTPNRTNISVYAKLIIQA